MMTAVTNSSKMMAAAEIGFGGLTEGEKMGKEEL